jgi:chaperonin GroEL
MPKVIAFGQEAREAVLAGMSKVNDAVKTTMGPAGRTVLFEHFKSTIATKDGVTVAREIELDDPLEALGARMIQNAARQAVEQAGDGTTAATLLTYSIFKLGSEAIAHGNDPVAVVKGIREAAQFVVGDYDEKAKTFAGGALETLAVKATPELLEHVATISANGDKEIADVVARAVQAVGAEGAISIGSAQAQHHSVEFAEGLQLDCTLTHPIFLNDPQRNRAVYDDVGIVVLDRRLSTQHEAHNIATRSIAALQQKGEPAHLLIIANDVDEEALRYYVTNRVQSGVSVVVVRSPGWGDSRRELLDDLCLITSATRIDAPLGKDYDGLYGKHMGMAARVLVTPQRTTITARPMSDMYRSSVFNPYVERLRAAAGDQAQRPDEIDRLKNRIAGLTGGVAVIKVGGTSADDVSEKKFRVEDAIHATRAALLDGVVPGAGIALRKCAEMMKNQKGSFLIDAGSVESKVDLRSKILAPGTLTPVSGKVPDAIMRLPMVEGWSVVNEAIKQPLRQILKNASLEYLEDELETSTYEGINVSTGEMVEDMIDAGIVDPLRVVRCSLNAAASAAAVSLLTECAIAEAPAVPVTGNQNNVRVA